MMMVQRNFSLQSTATRQLVSGVMHLDAQTPDIKEILESKRNTRNRTEVGWSDFVTVLEHHGVLTVGVR